MTWPSHEILGLLRMHSMTLFPAVMSAVQCKPGINKPPLLPTREGPEGPEYFQ